MAEAANDQLAESNRQTAQHCPAQDQAADHDPGAGVGEILQLAPCEAAAADAVEVQSLTFTADSRHLTATTANGVVYLIRRSR